MSLNLAVRPFNWAINEIFILTQPTTTLTCFATLHVSRLMHTTVNYKTAIEVFALDEEFHKLKYLPIEKAQKRPFSEMWVFFLNMFILYLIPK